MRTIPLILLPLLAGCGASVGPVAAPDGRQAYLARCGGLLAAHVDCRVAATDMCTPNGYVPLVAVPGSGRLTFVCAPPRVVTAAAPPPL